MLLGISSSKRAAAPGGHFLSADAPNRSAVRFMVAVFHGIASLGHTCE